MPLLVSSPSLGLSDGHYHLRICTPTRPFAEHPRPSRRQVGGGRCRDQATMWLPQPRVPSNPASISWDLRRGRSPRRPLPPRPAGGSFLGAPHPVAPLSCLEIVGHDQNKTLPITSPPAEKRPAGRNLPPAKTYERLKVVWLATSRNAYGPSRSTGLVSQRRLPPNQYQPRRPLLG
jgi:hypothetical protein